MADELEKKMWAQRGTVRRVLTGDGAKPSVVPWELRGLDAGAGDARWRQETADMDADMVSRVQPLLDELNATLDGPKLGIVHKDLHAWALNFNAGRSGGYTGRGRGDVCGGVFVTTWPPWTSMGLLVDEHGNTDGRVGNRLLDPKGRAMKWRFIYGKDGPQSLGDLYSRDNLRGCDVSQMDAASIDIVGNTKHALPSWLLGFREELAEGTFLQVGAEWGSIPDFGISDELRQRISERMTEQWEDPEWRAEQLVKTWEDPEWRAEQLVKIKEGMDKSSQPGGENFNSNQPGGKRSDARAKKTALALESPPIYTTPVTGTRIAVSLKDLKTYNHLVDKTCAKELFIPVYFLKKLRLYYREQGENV
ncbi:hypothetical protein T484DRAFT_1752336 [Baffinella frigidus]|nr:hypothetical protein T484DRAFT_1752336 [Cryptophyta sp. CCMP2293]